MWVFRQKLCKHIRRLVFLHAFLTLFVAYKANSTVIENEYGKLEAKVKDESFVRMKTRRLEIRSVTDEDTEELVNIFMDPKNVALDGASKRITNRSEFEQFYRKWFLNPWKEGKFSGALAVIFDERIIGQTALTEWDDPGVGSLGLIIDRKYWKRGIGAEVCAAMHHLYAPMLISLKVSYNGVLMQQVHFTTACQNTAVKKLADKYGKCKFDDLVPVENRKTNEIRESIYKIKRAERVTEDLILQMIALGNLATNGQLRPPLSMDQDRFATWAREADEQSEAWTWDRNTDLKEIDPQWEELHEQFKDLVPDGPTTWECCVRGKQHQNGGSCIRAVSIETRFDGKPAQLPNFCFVIPYALPKPEQSGSSLASKCAACFWQWWLQLPSLNCCSLRKNSKEKSEE